MNKVDYKQLMAAASLEIAKLKEKLQQQEQDRHEPIAVVGMACRFPGDVRDPEAFWQLLREGREGVVEITDQRGWRMADFYAADPATKGKISSRYQGYVSDIDRFDADFFGMAPKEAERLDPQQRLLLEVAWEALESAACAPDSRSGSNTGVFLGISCSDYATLQMISGGLEQMSAYDGTGNALSVAAGRLSYFLGLQGPCMAIDTACSSSLIAVSRAVQSLRQRECDAALTGGASLIVSPMNSIIFSTARMLSPDGKCKTFDAGANGYVRGEGVGLVYLKRLSDARRDNDRILGLIRGVASNQDGRSQGLTAPSESAQEAVIRRALDDAGVSPEQVTYVEAHGTGTPLGDPIEIQALGAAYCRQRGADNPLWVASAKTNLGHMETAAGIGGLIKTLLCLQQGELPPHLHFREPNPHIPWDTLPIRIPLSLQPWEGYRAADGQCMRLGAVSSFGFGGSNAHVILEQAPLPVRHHNAHEPRCFLFTLSARNRKALAELAQRYRDHVQDRQPVLADLCHTLNTGRAALDYRVTFTVRESHELIAQLDRLAQQPLDACTPIPVTEAERSPLKMGWLLRDEGAASTVLAADLPAYRNGLQQVAQALGGAPATALEALLARPDSDAVKRFAHQWARMQWWRSLGIMPTRMLGLGVAEFAVAVQVGVVSLEQALLLVQDASAARAAGTIEPFCARLRATTFAPARTSVIASVSGLASRQELSSPAYWEAHWRHETALERAMQSFQQAGITTLLVMGDPATLPVQPDPDNLLTIGVNDADDDALASLLSAAGQLWAQGMALDWNALDAGYQRCKLALPTYPFQRKRYWAPALAPTASQPVAAAAPAPVVAPIADSRATAPASSHFHALDWRPAPLNAGGDTPHTLLVFQGRTPTLETLVTAAEQAGIACVNVYWQAAFDVSADRIGFDYDDAAQWQSFWQYLLHTGRTPEHLIWGAALEQRGQAPDAEQLQAVLRPALLLAQSLGQARLPRLPRVWFVTRQALNERAPADAMTPVQAALHGFARVMGHEMHQNRVTGLDLDDATADTVLLDELRQTVFEDQIRYQDGVRQVARLRGLAAEELPVVRPLPVQGDKTYVITGGLGALGLLFARWLVAQGARHLVLAGRSAPGAAAQDVLAALAQAGAAVTVVSADVSRAAGVAQVFAAVSPAFPVGGVLHAAGVLDDGVIANQDWSRFMKVLSPKAQAAWWLHEATRQLPGLDFFVLFSSVAATLGSPGQSNYAAANAYLDALAALRQRLGLCAQVINWGPWAGGGMAASASVLSRMEKSSGIGLIGEQEGPARLATLLQADRVQTLVAAIDWTQAARAAGLLGGLPPLLRDVAGSGPANRGARSDAPLARQLQQARPNERHKVALHYLREQVQDIMGLEEKPDVRLPLQELGMDSLMAVELRNALCDAVGYEIPIATLFDYPTIQKMATYLTESTGSMPAEATVPAQDTADAPAPGAEVLRKALADAPRSAAPAPKIAPPVQAVTTRSFPEKTPLPAGAPEPIAVIGMACRFPGGALHPEGFWQVLVEGVDGIVPLENHRWDQARFFDADPDVGGKMYVSRGGLIKDVDLFDNDFFSISPREAVAMDPQQRLLLETSWSAIEAAGYTPEALAACTPGVYVGIAPNDYSQQLYVHVDPKDINAHLGTGAHGSMASGRLSYFLGFQGPCMTIDTACSSSLVAIHNASQALRAGECDAAIAGGCNLTLSPLPNVTLCRAQMLAPDGHCKTFDASADGYVRSEGCGILVLKRLSDALRDCDNVVGLIRGSAINQDGRSQGVTAPNGPAQEAVIRKALRNAALDAAEVDYVEAHGTGTRLGDPIEVLALHNTYGQAHTPEAPLVVGAVKSNIGHLEAAAGVAGVMKTLLAMQHGLIPANLNLQQISPYLQYDASRMRFASSHQPWPAQARPRRAAVSSFGFSGSNAHAVLEEAPLRSPPVNAVERPLHLLTLSGRTADARQQLLERYLSFTPRPGDSIGDIVFTANVGRVQHAQRAALVVSSVEDLKNKVGIALKGKTQMGVSLGSGQDPEIAFLFSGQGSQYAGMARNLYQHSPRFQRELDACRDALNPHLPLDLYAVLWGNQSHLLNQTQFTQPALFALEVALSNLLRSWGITPACVMGHSVGEFAAAYNAGVFSLEDGARLIAARGRLMQALPAGGKMCAVSAPLDIVDSVLAGCPGAVSVAAINTPTQTVISGEGAWVDALAAQFAGQGIETSLLDVSHAFHSPLMEPMLAAFAEVAASVRFGQPSLPVLSNLTGQLETGRVCTPEYWVQHVFAPVRFLAGIQALAARKISVLLEVGPKPVLLGMARATLGTVVPMIPCLRAGQDDWRLLLNAVGELYCLGAEIDWKAVEGDYQRQRALLPTYPFQGRRHWFEETGAGARAALGEGFVALDAPAFPLLGKRLSLPGSDDIRFESRYSAHSPGYLKDHKLFGTVVVPGASHMALFLAAAEQIQGAAPFQLTDICFLQPLVLPDGAQRIVHTLLRKKGANQLQGELLSIGADENPDDASLWVSHASALIELAPAPADDAVTVDPEQVQAEWTFGSDGPDFYRDFDARGYNLGESFRWLDKGWKQPGERRACWQMRWPGLPDDPARYPLYPSLIDACFQAMAGCDDGSEPLSDDEIYIPFAVADFRLNRPLVRDEPLWVVPSLRPREGEDRRSNTVDIQLFDASRTVVAVFTGVEARLASRAALSSNLRKDLLNDTLYELHWRPQGLDTGADLPAGEWLLLTDAGGVGDALARLLREEARPVWQVSPAVLEPVTAAEPLLEQLQQRYPQGEGCAGVLFLWALDAVADPADWQTAQARITGAAAALMKALARMNWRQPPAVWLLTAGANTPLARGPVDPHQTALWGLGRVFAMEHGEFKPVRLDLDPADPVATAAAFVRAELGNRGEREDQVMLRDGARYVARLVHSRPLRPPLAEGKGLTVRVPLGGLLDKLVATPMDRREPGVDEVEIEVRATALNFRDVLNALGMFRDYAERMGLNLAEFPLGFDCAGVVVRVGPGVTDFSPGDAVVAGAYHALSSHVIAHRAWVRKKPAALGFEQAAAIPTVFMTAWHALSALAQVQPGERVLIHAAAGGVGQAALQVALHRGAEVYATASPGKWSYLLGKGVKAVFHSREPRFADALLAQTGGQGVDVVLNSFNGDFIPESLKALAPGGRFIEIGKIGVWTAEQMQTARPDVQYHLFDVAEASRTDDVMTFAQAFAEVMEQYEAGVFQPLPVQAFALDQVVDAFRHLQSGRNVGKVVVTLPEPVRDSVPVQGDRSYLITGGLGSLGLRLADWLIARGARHLVLTSRRPPQGETQQKITAWQERQVLVDVVCCDIADPQQLARLFAHIDARQPPLAGVIHAAGVLDDGMLLQQDWSRFQTVYAAKFAGWGLHQATRQRTLDFFCCFSSLASLMGSPGQSNYAAANAYLDGLVQYRRSLGLPAIAFNWGPWADGGMAASHAVENRFNPASGVGYLSTERGLLAFERWLPRAGQFGVMVMDWGRVMQNLGTHQAMPVLQDLAKRVNTAGDSELQSLAEAFRQALANADPSERQGLMIDFICDRIAGLLGYDGGQVIDPRQPLQHLGLDSLMAVELRNLVNSLLGRSLPATLLFKYPSVEALTGYLVREIFPDHDEELAAELGTAPPASAAALAPRSAVAPASVLEASAVAALSDEDAARLLSESLAALQEVQP